MAHETRPRRMASRISVVRPRMETLEDRTTPAFAASLDLAGLTAATGLTANGFDGGGRAGASLAGIGDINHDGVEDVAIVAPNADGTGASRGQVYVVFGSKTGLPATLALNSLTGANGFTISGTEDFDSIGSTSFFDGPATVAGLGDINGDGVDDFVVGAQLANAGGADKGQAYVIFGRTTGFGPTVPVAALNGNGGFTITGIANNDFLGATVGGPVDFNHDGLGDILVGAPGADGGGTNKGQAYVIFGRATGLTSLSVSALNGSNGATLTGIADDDRLGHSVNGIGDFNGDGIDDIVIGAPSADAGGNSKGQVYVVFGQTAAVQNGGLNASQLTGTNGFSFSGTNDFDNLGTVVDSAGDFNSDGRADLLIGQPSGSGNRGNAYVVFGKAGPFAANLPITSVGGITGFRVTGLSATDNLGQSVAGGLDINADGFDDVVIGAPGRDQGGADRGAAYVVFGTNAAVPADVDLNGLTGTNGFAIVGSANNSNVGYSVGSAGDINGDGAGDVAVGAPTVNGNTGQTFVVFGQDEIAPVAILGSAPPVSNASNRVSYSFTVQYSDFGAVALSSLGAGDIEIVGPGGAVLPAAFVSSVPVDLRPLDARDATYQITPPGGRWDATDNGIYTIRVVANQVSDAAGKFVAAQNLGSFTVDLPAGEATAERAIRYAVGAGRTGPSTIKVYNADGTVAYTLDPFPGLATGVRVATVDVNADGIEDVIAGTGPGVATQVKVFDGATKALLFTVAPFEASFTGGVYVAGGDLDGDGKADVVVTPDEGGGPVVVAYSGAAIAAGTNGDAAQTLRFLGIEDPGFRGGARAAAADMNADGKSDLLVAAGFGGGPRVAVYKGETVATGRNPEKFFGDLLVFENSLRNGVFVTGGDLNGDGNADLIVGGGPGGGPRVFGLSGKDLVTSGGKSTVQVANFFAGDANNRGGVRVAVKNLDGDARGDVVTGAGDGAGAAVTTYAGKNIPVDGNPPPLQTVDTFPGFLNGVFVG